MINEYSLAGKKVIITGASGGIGRAVAVTMAEAGADVVLASRNAVELERTAQQVAALGRKAAVVPTDVTVAEQVENLAHRAVAELGSIDVLVNAIGISIIRPLVPMTGLKLTPPPGAPSYDEPASDGEWFAVINTNLTSVFHLCRALAPHMMRQGRGRIINISSIAGHQTNGFPYASIYSASKAGLNQLTRSLAREWARYQICVNAIAPGVIETPMNAGLWSNVRLKEWTLRSIPLGRFGDAREVALLAIYLASDASRYMTGQILNLDGGQTA